LLVAQGQRPGPRRRPHEAHRFAVRLFNRPLAEPACIISQPAAAVEIAAKD
jgi:hypothetical protein